MIEPILAFISASITFIILLAFDLQHAVITFSVVTLISISILKFKNSYSNMSERY